MHFQKKAQIINLQNLYSTVSVHQEGVSIDPLTLFLHLVLAIDRKPETDTDSYYQCKISPYPTSLSDNGVAK